MVATSKKYVGVPVGYVAYYTAFAISPMVRYGRDLVQGQLHEPLVADVQRWLYGISEYFDVDPIGNQKLRKAAQFHEMQVAEDDRIMKKIQRGVDSVHHGDK